MVLHRERETLESQMDEIVWSFSTVRRCCTSLISCKPLGQQKNSSMTRKMPSKSIWVPRAAGKGSSLLHSFNAAHKDVRSWVTGMQVVTDFGLKQPGEGLIQHINSWRKEICRGNGLTQCDLCMLSASWQSPGSHLSSLPTCYLLTYFSICLFSLIYI